jgi:hypothetical protein
VHGLGGTVNEDTCGKLLVALDDIVRAYFRLSSKQHQNSILHLLM